LNTQTHGNVGGHILIALLAVLLTVVLQAELGTK